VSAIGHSSTSHPHRRPKERLPRGFTLLCAALLALAAACESASSPLAPEGDTHIEPLTEPAPSAVPPGPLPGKVAFSASDGTQRDIYVMNPDGSNLTRLTSTPEDESSPAWSWDNTRIAFGRPRTGASAQVHRDIFVVDANGANGHWGSPTPSTLDLNAPAWSPDGSRILVRSSEGIMSLDLATGALTHFKNGQENVLGQYASFDPTGQKVVVTGGGVSVYRADGSGKVGFTMASPHVATVETPSFSPDGATILLTEAISPDRRKLYLFAGTTFTLLSSHGIGRGASWAPDGKQIVFGGRRGRLYRMNADGSRRVELAGTGGVDFEPAYSH
jgi:Tol biopolymer transport system component